jgi:hypothetical protein
LLRAPRTGGSPEAQRAAVLALLPPRLPDAEGWAIDIQTAFSALDLPASSRNVCAVIAIAEQESSLRADPAVPGLPRIAMNELEVRAARLHVPMLLVDAALRLESATGATFRQRIDAARTERDLSEIYEDFIGRVPLGRRLLADYNPVRTGGPMQVSIAFAESFSRTHRYPYDASPRVRHEVFTRRGGLYFGTAHLLAYEADYDALLYRFADYNAGQYASRNAAFQNAVNVAAGAKLALDGDLASQTELALTRVATRLELDEGRIRRDLQQGGEPGFARSTLYERVFALAEKSGGRALPRAMTPQILLTGPKITRRLTTDWFAHRVDERFGRCLARGGALAPS